MAYQTLNIIGSLTAGPPAIAREQQADHQRGEEYRHVLRRQMSGPNAARDDLEAEDRFVVRDAPQEERNPYLLRRRHLPKPREEADRADTDTPADRESAFPMPPGRTLDVVV